MAKAAIPLLLLLLFFNSVVNLTLVSGQAVKETWCVAKPSTDIKLLQDNKNYACDKADCSPLEEGGACFYPNTTINRASVAMNIYYKANGAQEHTCDFGNSGLITMTDPSYGDCEYS